MVIVRSAEAPRDLTENQIDAQLPSLARVLTAGYRGQVRAFKSIDGCLGRTNSNHIMNSVRWLLMHSKQRCNHRLEKRGVYAGEREERV